MSGIEQTALLTANDAKVSSLMDLKGFLKSESCSVAKYFEIFSYAFMPQNKPLVLVNLFITGTD